MQTNQTNPIMPFLEEEFKSFNIEPFTEVEFKPDEYIKEIEQQFRDGMTWENYNKLWKLIFILPKETFNFKDNFYRSLKQYFSINNLYPIYIDETIEYPENFHSTCYQYKTRFQSQYKEKNIIDFNPDNANLNNTIIREISKKECTKVVEKYEWLGKMSGFSKYHFGIYFLIDGKEYLGGVLAFQNDYGENTDVWKKYDFKGDMILLSRGVCLWWTPKNTASYFISKTYKWFLDNTNYRILTATTDSSAGESGVIYSALNWLGLDMNKQKTRTSVIIDGKEYSGRYMRKKYGTMKESIIKEKFPNARFVKSPRKIRYFYFIGKDKKYNKMKLLSYS